MNSNDLNPNVIFFFSKEGKNSLYFLGTWTEKLQMMLGKHSSHTMPSRNATDAYTDTCKIKVLEVWQDMRGKNILKYLVKHY